MHTSCVCYVSGCPVKLPRLNEIREKLECLSVKEKHILCDSLFLTINWFREVGFSELFETNLCCIILCSRMSRVVLMTQMPYYTQGRQLCNLHSIFYSQIIMWCFGAWHHMLFRMHLLNWTVWERGNGIYCFWWIWLIFRVITCYKHFWVQLFVLLCST